MSNHYFAFSTAPGAHAPGASVTGMLGHPSNHSHSSSNNNGMAEGMLSQHGSGSPGSMISGGNGGGMLSYAGPPSQSRQQQLQPPSQQQRPPQQRPSQQPLRFVANSMLNPGAVMFPTSSSQLSANGPGVVMNANCPAGVGGPAVPAPRSAATLIAEATGAPPPPPAPSLGVHASNSNPPPPPPPPSSSNASVSAAVAPVGVMTLGGSVNPSSVSMATPPAPLAGINTPMSAAVAAAGAGGSVALSGGSVSPVTADNASSFGASLVSPSFKAFTTSVATMLSTQGAAPDAAARGNDGTSASAANAAVGLLETAHDGHGAPPVTTTAAAAAGACDRLSRFSHVEVELTLTGCGRRDTITSEDGSVQWDPAQDVDDELDELGYLLATICCDGDDDSVSYTMHSLQDMDYGRSYAVDVFTGSDVKSAAANICKIIDKRQSDTADLRAAIQGLTFAIVSQDEFRVLLHLPRQEALTLRYSILKYLLERLVRDHRRSADVDTFGKKFTSMMNLGLVRSMELAAVIDTFLQHETMVSAALRLIALGLSSVNADKGVRAALEGVPRIAQRLHEVYARNRKYEVDVALITRLWQRKEPVLYGCLELESNFHRGNCPVTCLSYFGVRDELISGHMNGSVVLWGAPQMVREKPHGGLFAVPRPAVRPRGVVPLPLDCVPVGMAGQRIDGQYLAIASMPYKSRKPYLPYCTGVEARAATGSTDSDAAENINKASTFAKGNTTPSATRREAPNGAGVGAIIVITCNANSIRWNKGEVIMRPAGVALTAITAFRNSIVAVGESAVLRATPSADAAAAAMASPHRLSFVDVACGTVLRQILSAHDDYITALNVLDEASYVLLSGGRDAAVKLWDPRSREDSPVVNTALCTGAPTHNSTITAMCTTGYNIVSTAMDGSMLVWDLRSMEAPQVRHELDYPIVDVTLITGKRAVAATWRGLITVSLDTLEPLDMRESDRGYSHVMSNNTGELVFTASCCGVLHTVAVHE
ncbi:hypothetical protein ABB37_00097 [Leptomonas pyrrhocoris]|uniref:Uncharacterized protein n=1 Tax=Leptomonas pyrrhocoris TaxID=157538 RepID=A0A0M9G9P6_LEPPY|nr:hypothetical protein ABB37_00097 [Leptomonas pyrrhocoris]XP_015664169.1 hypothetical protein ABB37_00097 [Leptomonas pyrrhocoris]XP_015664170.1 hypothetical protein ABB37_00097 [Leptomonas pyrrhocoris]XP_015664171.1 hypothetical protein ABB37_00097 [Leptomonas pyrrhocoris]XP_015664172.1 hypothetical protein ABB37_00097 [Leptomonas pyrrhocoris]KPA85729.1 hypothetical protein ABB37_00097 [Leptomonas pyrrhocoris]KPA85730.1 hypothetical protein ABB37_00097 [Leptomonas pyrrhocoris]KPA85731.1 h|eukprot:XP_015664168.1 hypothetical protein ABB37_00097 [Leptomonas pyrrhocoris]